MTFRLGGWELSRKNNLWVGSRLRRLPTRSLWISLRDLRGNIRIGNFRCFQSCFLGNIPRKYLGLPLSAPSVYPCLCCVKNARDLYALKLCIRCAFSLYVLCFFYKLSSRFPSILLHYPKDNKLIVMMPSCYIAN